jgi:tripeptidyl-peptidase-2
MEPLHIRYCRIIPKRLNEGAVNRSPYVSILSCSSININVNIIMNMNININMSINMKVNMKMNMNMTMNMNMNINRY